MSALVLDDTQREVLDLQEAFHRIAPRLSLAEAWEFTGRFIRLRKAVGLPALMVVGGRGRPAAELPEWMETRK